MVLPNWTGLAAKVALALAVVGGAYYAGYDNATNDAKAKQLEAMSALIEKQNKQYEQDLSVLMTARDVEEKSKEIIDNVDEQAKDVSTPDCNNLGDAWIRLYNNSIEAANM